MKTYKQHRTFQEMLDAINEITKDCRPDMHEPDEQDISAIVTGTHLDNAMGADPNNNCCEFTVKIQRGLEGVDDNYTYDWFNLSSLIALARMAKVPEGM